MKRLDLVRPAVLAALSAMLLAACRGGGGSATAVPSTPAAVPAASRAAQLCAASPDAGAPPTVAAPDLTEISGLAASRAQPGVLWAHNDSGDSARVFALDRRGRALGAYVLAGADAVDWEDMAVGPGPDPGASYLYLADIGDNQAARPEVQVYRVREPDVDPGSPAGDVAPNGVDRLVLRYPDQPHDAETLLVDPSTGDLLIVTKELITGTSLVFRARGDIPPDTPVTLERVASIPLATFAGSRAIPDDAPPLPRALPDLATAGDISADGALVGIRTYGRVWIWAREPGASIADALATLPCEGPSAIEPQGEAIAFDPEGRGYTTVSEGADPPLHHFGY